MLYVIFVCLCAGKERKKDIHGLGATSQCSYKGGYNWTAHTYVCVYVGITWIEYELRETSLFLYSIKLR